MIAALVLLVAAFGMQPAVAPALPPATSLGLPAGTPVRLVTATAIDARSVVQGRRFALSVAEDVRAGGVVVIPRGTPAVGEVEALTGKGMFGKGGSLTLAPLFIDLAGRRLNLTGSHRATGSGAVAPAAVTTVLAGAFGLIITGRSARVPAGTLLNGELRDDTRLVPLGR